MLLLTVNLSLMGITVSAGGRGCAQQLVKNKENTPTKPCYQAVVRVKKIISESKVTALT